MKEDGVRGVVRQTAKPLSGIGAVAVSIETGRPKEQTRIAQHIDIMHCQ